MPATPANALDITSAGLVKFDGTATFSGVTVTQHDVLVGAASNGITSVAPSATTGVALVSQGAAADPAFGTVVVAGGGTGLTSITAHDLVVGNGTSALNLIAPSATSGVPLVSQGAAADPAFGTAVVAGGGTGLTSITAHDLVVGNGTSALNLIAPSASAGIPLVSNGAAADPSFTTAVVAGGGTGVTSFTAYAVICGGTTSTNPLQSIASVGTSGQVLTSNGAGALPTFQAVPGSLVELSTQTASSSTAINFTSVITATYSTYFLTFSKVVPATNSVGLNLQISTNNGSSYINSGYQAGVNVNAYNSATLSNSNSTSQVPLSGIISNANGGIAGELWLYNLQNGGQFMGRGHAQYTDTAPQQVMATYGGGNSTASVNAITLFMSSGNISTGIFTLYGLKQ